MLEEADVEVERKKFVAFWQLALRCALRRRLVIDSVEVALRKLIRQVRLIDEELWDAGDLVRQLIGE